MSRLPTYDELFKESETRDRHAAKLLKELEDLVALATKTDKNFGHIQASLDVLDNKDYVDESFKPLDKFRPRWVEIRNQWTSLLWKSYRTATATEVYIKDLLEVIIPVVEEIKFERDRIEALKDLKEFIEANQRRCASQEGDAVIERSQNLNREMDKFCTVFDQSAPAKLSTARRRHTYHGEGHPQLPRVPPSRFLSFVGELVSSVFYFTKKNEQVSLGISRWKSFHGEDHAQSLQKQTRVNNGIREYRCLSDARRDLKAQRLDMVHMTARLSQLADAPKAIASDAQVIVDKLETLVNVEEQGVELKAVKRELERIKLRYTPLRTGLTKYATQGEPLTSRI